MSIMFNEIYIYIYIYILHTRERERSDRDPCLLTSDLISAKDFSLLWTLKN